MRAFRLAVGTYVAQAHDVPFERLDADASVNVVDKAKKGFEDWTRNFENLKNSDLDTDNNGSLSREELQAKVQQLGFDPLATQVVEQIFSELNIIGYDQVEMAEFVEKLQEFGTKFAAEYQRTQQNNLDVLPGADFAETLSAAVIGVVEALETDDLSFADFEKHFLNTVEQFPDSEAVAANIRNLFYVWDTDKNGVVTKDEVKAAGEPPAQIFVEKAKDLIADLFH